MDGALRMSAGGPRGDAIQELRVVPAATKIGASSQPPLTPCSSSHSATRPRARASSIGDSCGAVATP